MSFNDLKPGQMFTYRGRPTRFAKDVGIGQVVGLDQERQFVFVELFGTRDDELVPFIGFVPLTYDAFRQSDPRVLKVLDVPPTWEERRQIWLRRWQLDEAGVFSMELCNIVTDTLTTVGRDTDIDEGRVYVELTFPRRDATGAFRVIEAHTAQLA